MRLIMKYAVYFALIFVSGCSIDNISRGSQISKDDMRLIEVGRDDISSVIKKFGAPVVVSPILGYDGFFRYYYVSSLYRRIEPFAEKFISQYILVITFDMHGSVVDIYDTVGASVLFAKQTTKAIGKYSFLSQLSESSVVLVGPKGSSIKLNQK